MLAHMKRDETELGDNCSKCGAVSYQGGYCFRCGTYRPSKHNLRDEELDAASFMEGNFGQRIRAFYAEAEPTDELAESEELTNPDFRPRGPRKEKPRKRPSSPPRQAPQPAHPPVTPPRPQIFYVHPDGTVLKNPPPTDTILENIERANRRTNRHPTQPPLQPPDLALLAVPPQSNHPVVPPPTRKPDVPTCVAPKPQPPPVHALEAPAQPYTPPPAAAPQPSTPAVSRRRTEPATTPPQQFTPPSQARRNSYVPTFFALWALLAASMSDRHTPVATAIILGAMLSVFLSFFVSFAIDWLIEQIRK